jgi:competence protein ComEA
MTNYPRALESAAVRLALAAALAVSCAGATAFAADAPDASAGKKININQASAAQIAFLPRVGPKAAERIVEYRKAHGTFAQPEELMEVKGVGEKLFAELKPYVALTGPTTLTAKVRSSGSSSSRSSGSSRASAATGKSKGAKPAAAPASASHTVPEGKGQ